VRIDLNADVGEAQTADELAAELALLNCVTSVNIACGAHAGDFESMARMAEAAKSRGVAVGAHPGYRDREGRGRRDQTLPPDAVAALVDAQVAALQSIALTVGVTVRHVKPHGALYNQAARDPALARVIATAVGSRDPSLRLVGLAGSALLTAGRAAGLPVASEAFVDRAYRQDGTLVPRSEPGAVLTDPDAAVAQALSIVHGRGVIAIDGTTRVAIDADTLCLHGDTPGALALARRVRDALESAGVLVRGIGE
jgi:UPF0271 protein